MHAPGIWDCATHCGLLPHAPLQLYRCMREERLLPSLGGSEAQSLERSLKQLWRATSKRQGEWQAVALGVLRLLERKG